MIAPWVGWSTGHPIVSACLFPPQHPDVYLVGVWWLCCSIVDYGGQLVDYGGLLYGQWWSMAVYWQSIGLRLSVGGHRGRSSVPSWLRSRDFRSLSAPLLLLHPTCWRAVGLKRRAVASLEREQTVPEISTLSQLTR